MSSEGTVERAHSLPVALFLAVACTALAWASVASAPADHPIAIWWPAAGVALLALIAAPRRWLWPVAGLLVLATAGGNLVAGRPADLALAFGIGNTVETLIAWQMLGEGFTIARLRDFWVLCRAGLVATAVSSVLFAVSIDLLSSRDPWLTLVTTLPSHLSAILMVVPVALTWLARPRGVRPTMDLVVQPIALIAVTAATLVGFDEYPLAFGVVPFLVWAAMRLDLHVVTLELALVGIAFLTANRLGAGTFARVGNDHAGPLLAEAFVISIVLSTVPLALGQLETRRAIRALRERENALAEETRFSRTLLDIAADLVLVVRHDGLVLQVTRGTQELLDIDPEQVIGRPVWDAVGLPEQRRVGPERWAVLRDRGAESPLEVDVAHRDGSLRRVVVRTATIPQTDEGQTCHVVVGVDVTREHNALGLLGHVLASPASTLIVGVDLDATVTVFNQGAATLLGRPREHGAGLPLHDLLVGPDPTAPETRVAGLLHGGPDNGEPRDWYWAGAHGPVLVATSVSPVRDATGRLVGHLLVGYDVTAEREAAERQRRLEQAKNDFIWTTSHEIRTPVTSIAGYAEMLLDGGFGDLDEDTLRAVDAIARNAVRLRELADNVLMLTGMEGVSGASHEPLDLAELLAAAAADLRSRADEAEIDLQVVRHEEPVVALGAARSLSGVLTHLIDNALKFTPTGGHVTVEALNEGDHAVLRITDDGIGIPADEVDHVFERFFRAANAHEHAIQGAGLGLSIVASVVEVHGGHVTVSSDPGVATVFTVALPRVHAEAAAALSRLPQVG